MQEIITYQGVVYPQHCDFNQHMNVMHYVGKFDQATWFLFDQAGITKQYLLEENRRMVAVDQHIQYFKEFLNGDLVIIKSKITEIKNKTIKFTHKNDKFITHSFFNISVFKCSMVLWPHENLVRPS